MATLDDVRRIGLSLPDTTEDSGTFRLFVDGRQFVWIWMERVDPKRARVPNREVIAVRVANELEKQTLLSMDPDVLFSEPHYDGFPAVLVRLPNVDHAHLTAIIESAWRTRSRSRQRSA